MRLRLKYGFRAASARDRSDGGDVPAGSLKDPAAALRQPG